MSERMYTQKEAAHLLGVTVQTVRRWVRMGALKQETHRQRGVRFVRYRRDEVARMLSYTEQMRTSTTCHLAN